MISVIQPLNFSGMSKKAVRKVPMNFRLNAPLVKRAEAFMESHWSRPTFTQIVEASVAEWLDRHAAEKTPKRTNK